MCLCILDCTTFTSRCVLCSKVIVTIIIVVNSLVKKIPASCLKVIVGPKLCQIIRCIQFQKHDKSYLSDRVDDFWLSFQFLSYCRNTSDQYIPQSGV